MSLRSQGRARAAGLGGGGGRQEGCWESTRLLPMTAQQLVKGQERARLGRGEAKCLGEHWQALRAR